MSALVILSAGCLHRHHAQAAGRQPQAPRPSAPSGRRHAGTAASGQATVPGATTSQAEIVQGEEGIATWYGHPYHGRASASGEIYNMYDYTAAHRTLPFGTQVRVHDLENGETVDVRINDRGPFVEGRIIDLSYAAAQTIHMVGPGSALVRLEILNSSTASSPAPPAPQPGVFAVQVGAFSNLDNAQRLKSRIEGQYGPVTIQSFDRGDGLFHRVRVGRESTEEAARTLANELQQAGFATETFVVRLN